ncbi:MAG: polyprenyl synthetase family protein [Chloroflexi bacterium]|nr:polyprenyl synthetase family protein [Chloroflexota bacterium]
MAVATLLEQCRGLVEAELRQVVDGRTLPLYAVMRYHLGWTAPDGTPLPDGSAGKGVRSALCLLACRAVGGDPVRAVPAAAALELVHNFSLIHDDIQDRSPTRRHRATVWSLWGEAQAINAGDGMYALARLALLRLSDQGVPPERVLEAARLLDEACLRLCEGQFQDMEFETRLDITVPQYLDMIGGKTASLIAASLHLGALLGTEDRRVVEQFRLGGYQLGLAFQVQDDILGVWGEATRTGKEPSDIAQRKKSLPIIYGLACAQEADQQELQRVYRSPQLYPEDVGRVTAILDRYAVRSRAQDLAATLYQEALEQLRASGVTGGAMDDLFELAAFLSARDY